MKIVNIPIFFSDLNSKNYDSLFEILKNYLLNNPCCQQYPNCFHPKQQSNSFVFDINNELIKDIKTNYFLLLKKLLNQNSLNILTSKCWVFYTQDNSEIKGGWHNHIDYENTDIKEKEVVTISGIFYLTDTEIGTEFKTSNFKIQTRPKKNSWFLFDSSLNHRPIPSEKTKERMVLATSINLIL